MHLGQKFVDIVEHPKHGRGSNMNMCVDCRILMLDEARTFLEMVNADFIITGEVVGQRPLSQVRNKMAQVEKETGLKGKLLRPLSAKLLDPTEPELSGMVDRELLEGISGRSRKRQMELAEQFGLEDYPTPASGCLLTDKSYSNRLRDLLEHNKRLHFDDLNLLRAGRHFRIDSQTKLIVGRDEEDNKRIMHYRKPHHHVLEAVDVGSPVTLLIGPLTDENFRKAAMITARYSSARNEPSVRVALCNSDDTREIAVSPAKDKDLGLVALK
jgi:tRNA U34 2-thiouridine synthase MnmA/TrmU